MKATENYRLKIILFDLTFRKKKKVFLNPFCHQTTTIRYYINLAKSRHLSGHYQGKGTHFGINNCHTSGFLIVLS